MFFKLDPDLKAQAMEELKIEWTYDSTGLEGNTLSLGDTAFLIREGLTVSGKSLREHNEVMGHARAVDLIFDLVERGGSITEGDLFSLHKAVQTEAVYDTLQPVGKYKKEPNGTYTLIDGKRDFWEYPSPTVIPELMEIWLEELNRYLNDSPLARDDVLDSYVKLHVAFVSIHPFADGNGRLARLLANLPAIKSGFPPILIDRKDRREYIDLLCRYNMETGHPTPQSLVFINDTYEKFRELSLSSWSTSMEIFEYVHVLQKKRYQARKKLEMP